MAGARLEKVGTIFARTSALLRKNVWPIEEKPIWYEIYALHPPYDEPRYDRMPEKIQQLREILYEEDLVREKFQSKAFRYVGSVNLLDNRHTKETRTQKFIGIYNNLKGQGALDDNKIFEVAVEQLNKTESKRHDEKDVFELLDDEEKIVSLPAYEKKTPKELGISANFSKALNDMKKKESQGADKKKLTKKTIDVKSLL